MRISNLNEDMKKAANSVYETTESLLLRYIMLPCDDTYSSKEKNCLCFVIVRFAVNYDNVADGFAVILINNKIINEIII